MFKSIKRYFAERRKRRFIIKAYFAYLNNRCDINTCTPIYCVMKDYEEIIKFTSRKQEEQQE